MTTEPFADQHAIIEAAQNRICEAEEQIDAALARIPPPPGAIATDHDDEWDYSELAGAYTRSLTMGRWQPAGDGSGRVRAEVALSVEQAEDGALREWSIYLAGASLDAMTADDARRVAAALLDAAAALEASQGHPSDRDDQHLGDHHLGDHHLGDPAGGTTIEAGQSRDSEPVA